jgi:HKD family nuclease
MDEEASAQFSIAVTDPTPFNRLMHYRAIKISNNTSENIRSGGLLFRTQSML